jgi:Flp pilus assembly protein TadG
MRRRSSRAGRRGAVLVEYALLLTAFAIPAMMGIVAGGVAMMRDYQQSRDALLRPFP